MGIYTPNNEMAIDSGGKDEELKHPGAVPVPTLPSAINPSPPLKDMRIFNNTKYRQEILNARNLFDKNEYGEIFKDDEGGEGRDRNTGERRTLPSPGNADSVKPNPSLTELPGPEAQRLQVQKINAFEQQRQAEPMMILNDLPSLDQKSQKSIAQEKPNNQNQNPLAKLPLPFGLTPLQVKENPSQVAPSPNQTSKDSPQDMTSYPSPPSNVALTISPTALTNTANTTFTPKPGSVISPNSDNKKSSQGGTFNISLKPTEPLPDHQTPTTPDLGGSRKDNLPLPGNLQLIKDPKSTTTTPALSANPSLNPSNKISQKFIADGAEGEGMAKSKKSSSRRMERVQDSRPEGSEVVVDEEIKKMPSLGKALTLPFDLENDVGSTRTKNK